MLKIVGMFVITAIAEIVGCYFEALAFKHNFHLGYSAVAFFALFSFAYLLSLHPVEAGRLYAAYGGSYVFTSLLWLLAVDQVKPTFLDLSGVGLIVLGSLLITSQFVSK